MPRLVFLLVLLFVHSSAWAMPNLAKGASPQEKFASMDKNGDGVVRAEEFFAFYPNMHESAFKAIDKDGNAGISLEEWQAFSAGHSRDMGGMSRPGVPGQGSMGGQMGAQPTPSVDGSRAQAVPPAAQPAQPAPNAKPLFEFAPKNAAQ